MTSPRQRGRSAVARVFGERVAIALLLGVGGYLTLASFVSDYTNFP